MDFAKCLEKNNTIIKLGYSFTYPAARVLVDKYLTRNLDFGKCTLDEKKKTVIKCASMLLYCCMDIER